MFLDADLDGSLDLAVVNGHIDDTVRNVSGVGYAQPPQLFLNSGKGTFTDVAAAVGGGFSQPKVGRGLAYGDFDRDGDLDLLVTTNNGPRISTAPISRPGTAAFGSGWSGRSPIAMRLERR